MRNYKFRGLPFEDVDFDEINVHIKKDEFIYGNLIVDGNTTYIVKGIVEATEDNLQLEQWIRVRPETVGQYVGLNDKNNVEIFEGDFVRMHRFLFDGDEYESELVGQIIYNEETASYCLTRMENKDIFRYMGYIEDDVDFIKEKVSINLFYGLHEESWEVIGNIHQEVKEE